MSQGANRRLRHVLLLPSTQYGMDQRLDTVVLGDQRFVVAVVAREVGQDASGAGEHVDVVCAEEPHQSLQQGFNSFLDGKNKAVQISRVLD